MFIIVIASRGEGGGGGGGERAGHYVSHVFVNFVVVTFCVCVCVFSLFFLVLLVGCGV